MKKGFTLAEVLITLAVIVVVAAITIPSVISSYQKNQFYTAFMKNYNAFSKVYQMSKVYNGDIKTWNWTELLNADAAVQAAAINKYIYKYLNIAKDCGATGEGCFSSNNYHYLNRNADGEGMRINDPGTISTALLADGTAVAVLDSGEICPPDLTSRASNCLIILVDINGEKEPNTFGKDTFTLSLNWRFGLIPSGHMLAWGCGDGDESSCFVDYPTDEDLNGDCSETAENATGTTCAAKLLRDGKMNY